jgi:gluconate kinase
MSGELLRKLEALYEKEKKKHPGISFASFLAGSALMELERREILHEAGLISLLTFTDDNNIVILKDARKDNHFVEVQIKGKRLKCLNDNSADCIHVGFALAIPEVRKALRT